MRKMLRRSRTFTPFTGRSIPRWGISIPIALCVWLLAAAAHAQQPPPVKTTWLSRISDEGADTARPLLGIQAEASGIAGSIAPDIPIPAGGGCAYCAANMFLALEQGGKRAPLPAGIRFSLPPVSVTELESITGNSTMLIFMNDQEGQLAFLRENLGAGDHAIIGIRVHDLVDGDITLHAVNVANVDGELLVFDAGFAAKGLTGVVEGVPLGEFFANGIPGAYQVLADDFSDRSVQVLIRTARDYSLPANHQLFLGWLDGEAQVGRLPSTPGASRVQIRSDELASELRERRADLRRRTCGTLV